MESVEGDAGVPPAPVPLVKPPTIPEPAIGGPIYHLALGPIGIGHTSPSEWSAPQGRITPCHTENTPTLSMRYGGRATQSQFPRDGSIPIRA